jgi:hypothetical protein
LVSTVVGVFNDDADWLELALDVGCWCPTRRDMHPSAAWHELVGGGR